METQKGQPHSQDVRIDKDCVVTKTRRSAHRGEMPARLVAAIKILWVLVLTTTLSACGGSSEGGGSSTGISIRRPVSSESLTKSIDQTWLGRSGTVSGRRSTATPRRLRRRCTCRRSWQYNRYTRFTFTHCPSRRSITWMRRYPNRRRSAASAIIRLRTTALLISGRAA